MVTKTEFSKLSDLEKEARGIRYEIIEKSFEDESEWGLVEKMLGDAFAANYAVAQTAEQWWNLAKALHPRTDMSNVNKTRIKSAFNRLVRAKYVRSRTVGGEKERHYELKFS